MNATKEKIKFCSSPKWAATNYPTLIQEPPSEGAGRRGNNTAGPRPAGGTHNSERRMSSEYKNEARH